MTRMVKRLSNLEIDEVSLVDKPANQHGLVAIAKSYQEDDMAIFDASGNEVHEDELQPGDYVYDEAGTEYVYTEGGADDEGDGDYDDDDVEKGLFPLSGAKVKAAGRLGRRAASEAGQRAGQYGRLGRAYARRTAGDAGRAASAAGEHVSRNRVAYGAGGGAAAVGLGAGEYHGRRGVRKSYGEEVLSELSKALTEDDRDQVIAKAMDRLEDVAKRNEELEDALLDLQASQEYVGFSEVAKSYELGDDEAIGGLLFRAAQVLPEEDLELLDRVFTGAGQISKAYFEEVGYTGQGMESDTMASIFEVAGQAVAKNADLGVTQEQAVTALFSANPAAYDEYEAEQRFMR